MIRPRLLIWLIALVALAAPPGLTLHAVVAPAAQAVADCPDHAPPPCPDEGTAKHAASACCPMMAGAVALLAPAMAVDAPFVFTAIVAPPVRSLSGRAFTKDPPPPRV
ncbi:MAG: hypothetical protein ISP45_12930 [Reyranella sp.]|nr:hypothetical protein [Reyranella sp.]